MEKQNSDNLSIGDVISFVALIFMGVTIFFGMNFKTLGDKIPSVVVAVLLMAVMTVFVFLAAHAKAQNRNQTMWRNVEYAMLILYVISLAPCYLYVSKFFDVYFNKAEITKQMQVDIDEVNKMFSDYNRKCESRCSSYQIALEAMSNDSQGRAKIASMLELNVDEMTESNIQQAVASFSSTLKGGAYKALEMEKNGLEASLKANIKNWNILFLPHNAAEMRYAKKRYADGLKEIYATHTNDIEKNIPEFETDVNMEESVLENTFTKNAGLSMMGLLATILLGGLGLVKYLFGEKRTVIDFKDGDGTSITEDGGFLIS